MFAILKAADPNWLVQGGQLYQAFPVSKSSLDWHKGFDEWGLTFLDNPSRILHHSSQNKMNRI
jgi:hypothetical protein